MTVQGIAHVGVAVVDWDRMLSFYRDVIGLKVDKIQPHPRGGIIAFLSASEGEVIELICYDHAKPIRPDVHERGNTGINHFGFKVDDVETEYQRLKALGVEFEGEVRPASPEHDAAAHFWDLEGNRLHITSKWVPSAAA